MLFCQCNYYFMSIYLCSCNKHATSCGHVVMWQWYRILLFTSIFHLLLSYILIKIKQISCIANIPVNNVSKVNKFCSFHSKYTSARQQQCSMQHHVVMVYSSNNIAHDFIQAFCILLSYILHTIKKQCTSEK